MAPSMPDPTAQPGMDAEDQADGGADEAQESGAYEICIRVAADGSLSVGVETDAQEAAEAGAAPGAPDADDAGYSPAKDIKDALTQALAIYKADGQADAQDQVGKRLQSAGFQSGYEED